nr:MAG TPA: hypothetical protein [Caudoviricetes sp.]
MIFQCFFQPRRNLNYAASIYLIFCHRDLLLIFLHILLSAL